MLRIAHWLKKELIEVLPAVLYFLIMFNLFHFAQGLMLQPQDIRFTSYLGATLGALLAGKVILVADSLPIMTIFPKKGILYSILWKFLIYSFFVLLVQILDHAVQQLYHSASWQLIYTHLKTMLSQPLFWGVQIFVLVFFLIFIVFVELIRAIGYEKSKSIFLGDKKGK